MLSTFIADAHEAEESRLTAAETRNLVDEILRRCRLLTERTFHVANEWIGRLLEDQPVSAAVIGSKLGWSESTIGRELQAILRIAREVYAERHGGVED